MKCFKNMKSNEIEDLQVFCNDIASHLQKSLLVNTFHFAGMAARPPRR